jgi:hypothetical protein
MAIALPTAAAAILGTLILLPPKADPDPPGPGEPITRGESTETFGAIQPADGSVGAGMGIRFLWHSVREEAAYTIMLTDEKGDVVWEGTSRDTSVMLPPEVLLEPGTAYFWYVDALLPGARTATTGIQSFSVER